MFLVPAASVLLAWFTLSYAIRGICSAVVTLLTFWTRTAVSILLLFARLVDLLDRLLRRAPCCVLIITLCCAEMGCCAHGRLLRRRAVYSHRARARSHLLVVRGA